MNRNTILTTKIRPTVIFDVNDKEHRYWAHQFVTKMSWTECPYVFAISSNSSDVYSMICRELAEYYSRQEFDVAKKPQPEKVVKINKVDRRIG